MNFLFHLDSFGEYISGGEIDMSDFLQTTPLSCSLEHLEDYYSKNNENVLHIETSNGKNCSTCNKSRVCKYKENIEREVERIVKELEEKELPLSVNINCREWSSNNSSLTR